MAEQETTHILIAYFTWADNTVVENPSAVDVDGNLFSIVVSEPYSSNCDECLNRATDEKANNVCPALVNHIEDMEKHDIVFLGFPNWWYTLPMAVLSFVEEYDFFGKIIVPFCTYGKRP